MASRTPDDGKKGKAATRKSRRATNEELRSANEEILSSNEELQSLNEELETVKEELQSTNEELITVNDELHERNVELAQVEGRFVYELADGRWNVPLLRDAVEALRRGRSAVAPFDLKGQGLGHGLKRFSVRGHSVPHGPDTAKFMVLRFTPYP